MLFERLRAVNINILQCFSQKLIFMPEFVRQTLPHEYQTNVFNKGSRQACCTPGMRTRYSAIAQSEFDTRPMPISVVPTYRQPFTQVKQFIDTCIALPRRSINSRHSRVEINRRKLRFFSNSTSHWQTTKHNPSPFTSFVHIWIRIVLEQYWA